MGVSGSGKSTIGKGLSQKTGIPFFDGDDFHPESNIRKMASGKPLNDEDRQDWLEKLNALASEQSALDGAVIACSALKESYRRILSAGIPRITWIHLTGSFQTIMGRLESRDHEFMPKELLQSQFDTLEEPDYGFKADINTEPAQLTQEIIAFMQSKNEFGVAGLGVMGTSLARNLGRNKVSLSLYNRHLEGTEEGVAKEAVETYEELNEASAFEDAKVFVESLETPRKILMMVPAGEATDSLIGQLFPYLSAGDVLIDGGNAHYTDTQRRQEMLGEHDINLIGAGVSGGEEGALNGPSIMPGGGAQAYELVSDFLEMIAAKDHKGKACCTHIGSGGAGHFVKMVHNGIEYAEMQLLAEMYQLLRFGHGLSPDQIADEFEKWTEGDLDSYLLGITIDILRKKEGDGWLIDQVLDQAGNKGTGSWTTIAAAELGVPVTMITAALNARYISSFREERTIASFMYETRVPIPGDIDTEDLGKAYQLARVINHHQGIHLLSTASKEFGWKLKLWEIARIWTNGCIIRSRLMEHLITILGVTDRILFDEHVQRSAAMSKSSLERVVTESVESGLDSPCFFGALNYFNSYTAVRTSANIIQAQRDYFGAHTYKRIDDPEGPSHHTDWKS